MDKLRLYQISSVLLLPYREKEFLNMDTDVIANLRYLFSLLQYRCKMSKTKAGKLERQYYSAEKKLENFFVQHSEWNIHNLDDFRMLVNLFFPEEEIGKIYQSFIFREKEPKDSKYYIDLQYLKNIFRISKSLLTFRDGRIAIRTWMNERDGQEEDIFGYSDVFDKIELWNIINRMMIPDAFIAAFIADAGLKDEYYLYNQNGSITLADKTLELILQKGVAETHLHFNAGISYGDLWQKQMDIEWWQNKYPSEKEYGEFCEENPSLFASCLYRMVWAEYLEEDSQISFEQFIKQKYKTSANTMLELFRVFFMIGTGHYDSAWIKLSQDLCNDWKKWYHYKNHESDFLRKTLYQRYGKYCGYSEIILMFKSFQYFQKMLENFELRNEAENLETLHLFLQYIRNKNYFLSSVIQTSQIQGLANFQRFYRENRKKEIWLMKKTELYKNIFHNMVSNMHMKKLEIRIAPEGKMYSLHDLNKSSVQWEIRQNIIICVKEILEIYREMIVDRLASGDETFMPTMGIILHFIKSEYVDNRIGDMCWIKNEKNDNDITKHLIIWRATMVAYGKAIEELRSEIPLFGKYVVGIDAASEEIRTEPWIFAPVYEAIRNKRITKPVLQDQKCQIHRINNIGFTYHVGEEFRHLLSGLRHVDEVIRHFHYKAGDRLGHAICLGVDVDYWTRKNEVIVLPAMEQMENLLWIWGHMVYDNWTINTAPQVLEGKIQEIAKRIYGEIIGMSVSLLYEAYQEKFRLHYEKTFEKLRQYIADSQGETLEDPDHFCRFYTWEKGAKPYGIIWTKEKILCTYFCPHYYQKFSSPILVHTGKNEAGLLKQIQEYIVGDVERKGIYVEVNPTSNTMIGEIPGIYEEHILKLNSKGLGEAGTDRHEVLVTVNSDDPVIFNTNCENELAYMYHALVHKGYKKESVLEWIDKVRRMGMESSFIKEELTAVEQAEEMGRLLENMADYLKNT